MVDVEQGLSYNPDKNANLKGRKRFNADLADIQAACKDGLEFSGLKVKSESKGLLHTQCYSPLLPQKSGQATMKDPLK